MRELRGNPRVTVLTEVMFGIPFNLFMPFFSLAILVVHVMAIVKGVNGGRLIIPGVSEYASRF